MHLPLGIPSVCQSPILPAHQFCRAGPLPRYLSAAPSQSKRTIPFPSRPNDCHQCPAFDIRRTNPHLRVASTKAPSIQSQLHLWTAAIQERDSIARRLLFRHQPTCASDNSDCVDQISSSGEEMSEVIVDIPQGKLRGKKEKSALGSDFYCFHRIPYAKPPVGDLRFRAPQPADGWSGVRDATEEGSACPSVDWFRVNLIAETREDSLFVNVYCKQKPTPVGGKKLPVMVWIHGGGFELGSGNRNVTGPDYFMEHDIILVTLNYRIGVFGFLSLQTIECPGNFGLKDQQLALRWVKANIPHFGGDPDNITLFGISAGGASVHYQTLALSNRGLFHRAIIQSGSALNRWAHARRPREAAYALAKRLGCDTKDDKVLLQFLRTATPEDVVLKALGVINETEGEALGEWFLNFTFVPTVEPEHEGAFITEHPWVLIKKGKYLDVPLITGVTSDEMILGVRGVDDYPRFVTVEEFQGLIPRDLVLQKNSERALTVANRIKQFYCKDGVDLNNYINVLSDNFFNFGVFKYVKARTTNKNVKSPTYLYEFSYDGDQTFLKKLLNLSAIKGIEHGYDTVFLFKTDFANLDKMTPGSRDYHFMQRFIKLWVSFAATGVPALDEPGFSWKKTSYPALEYLQLAEEFAMKEGHLRDRMAFWDELYTAYYDD